MANLKEIRIRIGSVSSTMQITSAMKMVSAAKLKKAQDAITAMRPYSNKLSELMQRFSGASEASGTGEKSFTNKRKIKKITYRSRIKVTGPSLINSTFISAANFPMPTFRPDFISNST